MLLSNSSTSAVRKLPAMLTPMSSSRLIIITSLFLISFANMAFFSHVLHDYPLNFKNLVFLFSLVWIFSAFIVILLGLVCYRHTLKPILVSILLISSFAAYFMDSYNTVIDEAMIQNIMQTSMAESLDLFSLKLVAYVILMGILPAYFVYKTEIRFDSHRQEAISRIKLLGLTLLSVVILVFSLSDFYSSFFREHKSLRYYANPGYYIYSLSRYIGNQSSAHALVLHTLGEDVHLPASDVHRELVIFVVGETARADRFSLNGYQRDTNPLLKQEPLVSFTNFWSCGTSTAISVPCMFSSYNASDYDDQKGLDTENVLDILKHAGVNLLWLDNNSNSKGVAERIEYHDMKLPANNPVCDEECRDEGMLQNLQQYIDAHPRGDIFIVLHQMGNHGPAYYKRYPKRFEKFTPVCNTNQLEDCTTEEISNTYDNAILYTDYFLSKVIDLLKQNDNYFETAMFYVSDHGESLGENGLYLHGLPNLIAPDNQRHVPAIIWLGKHYDDVDMQKLVENRDNRFSHDNVFHTILSLLEMETQQYNKDMDILFSAKLIDNSDQAAHK